MSSVVTMKDFLRTRSLNSRATISHIFDMKNSKLFTVCNEPPTALISKPPFEKGGLEGLSTYLYNIFIMTRLRLL